MSIHNKIASLQNTVEDIRQSIVNKGVPVVITDGFKVYPDAVRAIKFQNYIDTPLKPTIHGVNYYDYNGDLLYVYTPQEFLALSAHPSQPSHTGLVADGWNWELTDAQDFIENTCDCLNIGAHYKTESDKTEIYFTLDALEGEDYSIPVFFRAKRTNSVYSILIDWGDGNTTEITTGINTGFTNISSWHLYSNAHGNYCIKVTATNVLYTVGNGNSYNGVFGYSYTNARCKIVTLEALYFSSNTQITTTSLVRWGHKVKEISIPKEDYTNLEKSITTCAFQATYTLTGIVIPEGITVINDQAFTDTLQLKALCLPKSAGTKLGSYCFRYARGLDSLIVAGQCATLNQHAFSDLRKCRRIFINGTITSIPNYCFNTCTSLEEVTIPDTIKTLGTSAFYECLSLQHLHFTSTLTSIGTNCFNYCSSLKSIIFQSTTPPTAGTTIFGNCVSLEKIYVPYSSDHGILNAYKTATNWTQYASKIYELDEKGNIPND